MSINLCMVMVQSLDGIASRNPDESVKAWTSLEDQKHLIDVVSQCDAVITGNKSFGKKKADVPYFVFSQHRQSTPEEEAAELHFVNEAPKDLIARLEQTGFKNVLLLGGPSINHLFLENQLVDELLITLEPKLFGDGLHLVNGLTEQDLRLKDCKILNEKGTLLLDYQVIKAG